MLCTLFHKLSISPRLVEKYFFCKVMTAIQGVIMSNSLSKTTAYVQIIQNDQQAINAAYQVADYALEGRNTRDQQRLLPHEQIESFSQKGLGGIRISKKNMAELLFPIKH